LGIQSKSRNIEDASLCPEAKELLNFLSSRAKLVGVRGEFTKQVVEKNTGIKNIWVTGCPSLFSIPSALSRLKNNLRSNYKFCSGAINVTNLSSELEKYLFQIGLGGDCYFVEPVNKRTHEYFLNLKKKSAEVPFYFDSLIKSSGNRITRATLDAYLSRNYRLFRNTKAWYEFNAELVDFTIGTRFHANMASVLSGVPALWITHDARTEELTEFLKLPSLRIEEIRECDIDQLTSFINYDSFFGGIEKLFDNFNFYLNENGLPAVKFEV
jgi:hypothetical protein